jgi:hypothetical protein
LEAEVLKAEKNAVIAERDELTAKFGAKEEELSRA